MKCDYVINEEYLKEIRSLFWIVHCDESKADLLLHDVSREVLIALERYRKVVSGEI